MFLDVTNAKIPGRKRPNRQEPAAIEKLSDNFLRNDTVSQRQIGLCHVLQKGGPFDCLQEYYSLFPDL